MFSYNCIVSDLCAAAFAIYQAEVFFLKLISISSSFLILILPFYLSFSTIFYPFLGLSSTALQDPGQRNLKNHNTWQLEYRHVCLHISLGLLPILWVSTWKGVHLLRIFLMITFWIGIYECLKFEIILFLGKLFNSISFEVLKNEFWILSF